MAASRRNQNKTGGHTPVADDEAHAHKDRLTLILFGVGAIIIVIGMWLLATFLSGN